MTASDALWTVEPIVTAELEVPTPLLKWRTGWGTTTTVGAIAWLLRGSGGVVLVDAGIGGIQNEQNLPQRSWESEGAIWRISERGGILDHLALEGLSAADIDALVMTHLHFDHFGNAPLFPEAEVFLSGPGLEHAIGVGTWTVASRYPYDVIEWMLEHRAANLHRLSAEESEIVPGIAVRLVGGHTPCSLAVTVQTGGGPVVLGGDIFPLFDNIRDDLPTGNYHDLDELLRAMPALREQGTVLPSHDLRVVDTSSQ